MPKINFQTQGLTPADFACSRMRHLGCGNPAKKPLLWKPCLADQQGSVQGLEDTEAGWERASGGAAAWPQDKPLPQDFPCHLQAIFSLEAPQQESHRQTKLPTSKGSWSHPQSESALALGLIWALIWEVCCMGWGRRRRQRTSLSTAQPSPSGLKEGPRALPSPTPLSSVERYIKKKVPKQ